MINKRQGPQGICRCRDVNMAYYKKRTASGNVIVPYGDRFDMYHQDGQHDWMIPMVNIIFLKKGQEPCVLLGYINADVIPNQTTNVEGAPPLTHVEVFSLFLQGVKKVLHLRYKDPKVDQSVHTGIAYFNDLFLSMKTRDPYTHVIMLSSMLALVKSTLPPRYHTLFQTLQDKRTRLSATHLRHLRTSQMARKIQRAFRSAIANPYTTVCRARLMGEWRVMKADFYHRLDDDDVTSNESSSPTISRPSKVPCSIM